jgi:hypothetical protein
VLRGLDLPKDVIVLADKAAGESAGLRPLEAPGAASAHRGPTAGNGFQRHAAGPRPPHLGGRAMTDETENLIAEAIGAAEDIPDPLDGLVEKPVLFDLMM